MAFNLEEIHQKIVMDTSEYLRGAQDIIRNSQLLEDRLTEMTAAMRLLNTGVATNRPEIVSDADLKNLNLTVQYMKEIVNYQKMLRSMGPGGTTGATATQLAALGLGRAGGGTTGATPAQLQAIMGALGVGPGTTGASPAQLAAMRSLLGGGGTIGATPAQVAAIKALLGAGAGPGTTGATQAQLQALGLAAPPAGGAGGAGAVTAGLHPYYLMHQFHTIWVEGGQLITYSIKSGLAEVSQLVAHGVQAGMASIGHQVAQVLHASLGIGGAVGQGIGGIGSAIGGGISRYGQAYSQGIGGMIGAGITGAGTAATAGIVFASPIAAAATAAVGAANVLFESVRMKIDMGLAAMATNFNLAMSVAQAFGGTISEVGEKLIVFGAQMERDRVTIAAFAQDSGQMFNTLQRLSREMPIYSFHELASEMKTLVAEGIPLGQIEVTLQKLGDIAHGDTAIFHRAALAVGEIFAQGHVTSQRIRQLASIGIGTGDLATAMGLDESGFITKLHQGEVGVDDLIKALNNLTSAGGRFYEQNAKQLDTVFGQWTRLRTIIDQTFGKIGEALLERAGLKEALSTVANWFEDNFERIREIVFAVFERIRAIAETVSTYIQGVWAGVVDQFGLTSTTVEGMLPSIEAIRDATKDMLDYVKGLAPAFLDFVRTGLAAGLEVLEKYQKYKGSKDDDWFSWLFRTQTNDLPDTAMPGRSTSTTSKVLQQFDNWAAKALAGLAGTSTRAGLSQPSAWRFGPFGAMFPQQIPERGGLSPIAKKFLEEVERKEEGGQGGTAWEQFQKSQRAVTEIRGRMAAAALLPLGAQAFDIKGTLEKANRGEIDSFDKLAKGVKPLTDLFPPTAFQYSSQAQDTINRSQFQTRSIQEEVRDILTRSQQEAIEQTQRQEEIARTLNELRDQGFKLQGDGAGIK